MNDQHTTAHPAHSAVGQAARDRDARRYVTLIRPLIAAFGLAAALLDLAFGPHATAVAELTAVGVLLVTLIPVTTAVLTDRLNPRHAIFIALGGDLAAIATMVMQIPHPELAACSFVLLVPLLGYFTPARTTLITCIVVAVLLSVGGPRLDGWDDPTVIPWSAFIVLATGITAAFVCARMRATERALEARIDTERAIRERLEQVDRSRERLIANVSHELRTPLTSTIGSVETLLRTDVRFDDNQRDELLRLARDGGLRLLSLVEDLLTLGVTRPDSLHLESEAEPLEQLVRDAVVGIDPGHDRAIVVNTATDSAVTVDRLRMMQVIANLVTNGVRHGAGDVLVTTTVDERHATICVHDDGDGVPPEHIDELFLPFARFSTRSDSTGLGLAISRTIVEAHGGTISYGRTPDQHTQFVVELPRNSGE